MKLRRLHFLAVLSISFAGSLAAPANVSLGGQAIRQDAPGSLAAVHDQIPQMLAGTYGAYAPSICNILSSLGNNSSERTTHADKRHGKSLISEAIVADFYVPAPQFVYCSRKYYLFLAGGCSRRPLYHSRLRGPPFCC